MRKGQLNSPETRLKISLGRRGQKSTCPPWNKGLKGFRAGIPHPWKKGCGKYSHSWKGDNIGYRHLHIWVVQQLGKPNFCTKCGKEGYGHQMHWANIDHKHRRNTSDWLRLCAQCHSDYDKRFK